MMSSLLNEDRIVHDGSQELTFMSYNQHMQLYSRVSDGSISVLPVSDDVRKELSFPKVELHLHLDGAVRHQTLLDLSLEKKIDLKGAKTIEDVSRLVVTHEPANLSRVLAIFNLYLPVIVGDKDAIERIAYEMCEDQAKNGVIYFEARYSPHFLSNTAKNYCSTLPGGSYDKKGPLDPRGVVEAVKKGFDRGEAAFHVKARSILCCIRGYADWNEEILEMASSLKSFGVVGIDVAGCAHGADEQYEPSVLKVFQEAAVRGIHRTVHAGESGGSEEVLLAVNEMKAERIGHGYRLLRDEAAYKKLAVQGRIHLETCPYSSIMTGSVPVNWPNHPVKRFATDDVNFSINTDDPTCLENTLMTEYQLAFKDIGLTKMQLWKCSLNAARSCFATDEEKKEIIAKIEAAKPTD